MHWTAGFRHLIAKHEKGEEVEGKRRGEEGEGKRRGGRGEEERRERKISEALGGKGKFWNDM